MNQATQNFIEQHLQDDVIQLQLKSKTAAGKDVDMQLALRQIAGRQKIRMKVPEWYNHSELIYPTKLSIEQSSSSQTASYKAGLVEGLNFVDLTGGLGIDFSFIAPKFKKSFYIERNTDLCELAKNNFRVLGIQNFEIHNTDAQIFLKDLNVADCIFIDPHRRSISGSKTVLIEDCEPNVKALAGELLQKSSHILIKLSPMLDISRAIRDLPETFAVHVLAIDNECKEILLELKQHTETKELFVHTINFRKNATPEKFRFTFEEESAAIPLTVGSLGRYFYEPNAAIMKAGAFKTISVRYQVQKIHINTHLYTSDELRIDFPGRLFEIIEVFSNSKTSLKQIRLKYSQANVNVRNYPLSVADFRKRTGIREGGDNYIFAIKSHENQLIIVVCRKVDC